MSRTHETNPSGLAIPGCRGVEHVGFTVPSLDEAEAFLVGVLGCRRIYSAGPVRPQGDWMKNHLNVDPDTTVAEWRFYRCGNSVNLEVFEYAPPHAQARQPQNSDIGGHHLAFYVEDIDVAVEYLRSHDVEVLAGPSESAGPAAGQRWVYFLSPWGMQFELVSFPRGKAYEETTGERLWMPRA